MSDHVPTFSDLTNAWQEYRDIGLKDASQEIQNLIDDNRADAWDEGADATGEAIGNDGIAFNPYRKQEEA